MKITGFPISFKNKQKMESPEIEKEEVNIGNNEIDVEEVRGETEIDKLRIEFEKKTSLNWMTPSPKLLFFKHCRK